jgi:hypothetical protein
VKKPVLIVAVLTMVLVVSAPALTQTLPTNFELSPAQESGAVQYSGDASADPAPTSTPAPDPASTPAPAPTPVAPTVGCGILYDDPTATCPVDENGNITLPDGTTAPVLVQPDGTAFVQDSSGALTLIGQGASFITGGGTVGSAQDDSVQGEPQIDEPVTPSS